MNRKVIASILAIVLLGSGLQGIGYSQVVDIPDHNLRASLERILRKERGAPITKAEMATLTKIRAPIASISDLTGLEFAINLTSLELSENSISDISVLAGLTNLTGLSLWQNSVSDISALAGLTNLTWLSLGGNSVSDISALAGLTKLSELFLRHNLISDLSALEGLKNLEFLFLDDNSISDLSGLEGLTNLIWLELPRNSISDLSPLAGLTNLVELNVHENLVSDLSPLVENTSVNKVIVRRNPLNYPSIFTHIPTLWSRSVVVFFDSRAPQTLLKIAGDEQRGVLNTALNPFVIEVRDQKHTVFEGVPVTFEITTGGGTLSVEYTETDANGRAESTLTLGSIGTNTVQARATDLLEPITFITTATTGFTMTIPKGVSLVHIPLDVTAVNGVALSIDTVGDFFDILGDAVNFILTYDTAAGQWRSYLGDNSRGSGADVAITDDLGLITVMRAETTLTLIGDALGMDGISRIRLSTGLNLVGLPLNDERLRVVSDLMRLPAFADVVTSITVYVVDAVSGEGKFRTVARAGDDGDIALTGDISMLVTAIADATVGLSGSTWDNSVSINGGGIPR